MISMQQNDNNAYNIKKRECVMIPFYKTFPFLDYYKNESQYEDDLVRVKEMYTGDVAMMQGVIEKRCDELEYEGSWIYDEFPDRQRVAVEKERISANFMTGQDSKGLICTFAGILFDNELCRRRCRYRRYSRFW